MVTSILGKYSPRQRERRGTGHREETRVQMAGQVPEQAVAEKGECCGLKRAGSQLSAPPNCSSEPAPASSWDTSREGR